MVDIIAVDPRGNRICFLEKLLYEVIKSIEYKIDEYQFFKWLNLQDFYYIYIYVSLRKIFTNSCNWKFPFNRVEISFLKINACLTYLETCVKYSRPPYLDSNLFNNKIHLIRSDQPQSLEFNIARREAIKVVGKLYERIFSARSFQPMENHNFPMIVDADGNFVNEIFEFHPRIPSPSLCLWPPRSLPLLSFSIFLAPCRHTLRPISGQLSKLSNNFSFSSVVRVLSFVPSVNYLP